MYTDDFKSIVLEDFYLNDKISNTENYHNIKKWLRYQLFPCRDADFVLRNKTILTKLNWPIDNNKIYIDCIFSMKTYFNMFLRMYNPKSSQSYAWLLTYFDDIFSYKHILDILVRQALPQLSVIIVISHVPQLCFKQLPATSSIHCTFYHF